MAKSKKKASQLKDKELEKMAGGTFTIRGALHDVESGLKRGVSEAGDTLSDIKKTVEKTADGVADGFQVGGKTLIESVVRSGKDLYQGKVGDAALELVEGPINAGKAFTSGIVQGAEGLVDGTIDTGRDLLKATLDLGTLGTGDAISLTPKLDGFIDSVASELDTSVNTVGTLTQDVSDMVIDTSMLPFNTLATSFDAATHGKFTKAASDLLTVPLDIEGGNITLAANYITDPSTIMGLLNAAGVIATFATFGAAAPEAGELLAGESELTSASAATSETVFGSISSRLETMAPDMESLGPSVQTQFVKVQEGAADLMTNGASVGLKDSLSGNISELTSLLKGITSPKATAIRISLAAIQSELTKEQSKN